MDYVALREKFATMHPNAKCELNYENPFQLLIAVILSAQCTDKRVNAVTPKLFKTYKTPNDFAGLQPSDLKPYIFSCGFYNSKAKSIIETAKAIGECFGGEVPSTIEALTKLRGVGRKTASVVVSVAFGAPAIPVDTHVFRVAKRLGLSQGKTPEKVEADLKKIIPKQMWNEAHHHMIFHGRYICFARKPRCEECLLANECNSAHNAQRTMIDSKSHY
ncbi:MAG: endonuclease III [Firmicutes bacterium]|nr:endonuclease III [Bacillota bacterium]